MQRSQFRHEGTGKIVRDEKNLTGDRRKMHIVISARNESLDTDSKHGLLPTQTSLAKVLCKDDGYWIYHRNKVDLKTMFSQPEEKLWLVVQDYTGALDTEHLDKSAAGLRRGFKLEKNSVIKLGRVRLRVRDIDYADDKPFKPANLIN